MSQSLMLGHVNHGNVTKRVLKRENAGNPGSGACLPNNQLS